MKVINKTDETLIAFSWDTVYGVGNDFRIEPGETQEIIGPYIEKQGCFLNPVGEAICQKTPDDENGFQIEKGKPLVLEDEDTTFGITIRHYSESRP